MLRIMPIIALLCVLTAGAANAAPARSAYDQLLKTFDDIDAATSTMPVIPDAEDIEYTGDSYIWPIDGVVTSSFGWRIHPVFGDRRLHNGIDIAVEYGVPVFAAKNGTVGYAGWMEGYGLTVIIEHDDKYSTLYGHNSELLVAHGTSVSRGQPVALTGNTGITTGPVLHFEVRDRGRATDPLVYLANAN
jgi:murein DD-endopeptidase MepM/ murein hydrolase activator NlpD